MNEPSVDLNSDTLINNARQPQSSRRRHISLLNPSSLAVRRNLTLEMRQSINDSINYNIALVVFSLVKVIGSAIILKVTKEECDKSLRQWTYYMIIHDIVFALSLALKIKTIATNAYGPLEERGDEEAPGRDIFGYRLYNDDSVFSLSEEAERKNRLASALVAVCKTYYYALFIYAQILHFHIASNCPQEKLLVNLGIVYIAFGYIYIGMPVLFVILACLCLPFLLFFSYIFSRSEQVPVTKDTLKNLPVIAYTKELPGNHECSICMGEYKEGDMLIQLNCSPMHHYHDDCLKKWLNINGLCPICRARIEEEKPRRGGDVEMANTMLNSQDE